VWVDLVKKQDEVSKTLSCVPEVVLIVAVDTKTTLSEGGTTGSNMKIRYSGFCNSLRFMFLYIGNWKTVY